MELHVGCYGTWSWDGIEGMLHGECMSVEKDESGLTFGIMEVEKPDHLRGKWFGVRAQRIAVELSRSDYRKVKRKEKPDPAKPKTPLNEAPGWITNAVSLDSLGKGELYKQYCIYGDDVPSNRRACPRCGKLNIPDHAMIRTWRDHIGLRFGCGCGYRWVEVTVAVAYYEIGD